AIVNAYVASYYTTEEWVNFKIWGYVFPLAFIVGTGIYIAKNIPPETASANDQAGDSQQ
ncbi:MAG: putative intracellular septation protein, partial [Pseudomonadota bacterium]